MSKGNKANNINEFDLAMDIANGEPYPKLSKKYDLTIEHICRIAAGKFRPNVEKMVKSIHSGILDSLRKSAAKNSEVALKTLVKIIKNCKDTETKRKACMDLLGLSLGKKASLDVTSGGRSLFKVIEGIEKGDI